MNGLPEILRAIEDSSDILVIAHIQPDGDTLGSCFALLNMLRRMGKRARLYSEDGIPHKYCELFPADALAQLGEGGHDTMIALDCADKSRLGKAWKPFKKAKLSVNIDHHVTNERFAKINYIAEASSVGEIIFELMRLAGVEQDGDSARYLYIAISTDTGNFTYSNTSSKCLLYVSELVELFDLRETADMLFRRRSLVLTRLIARALSRLELYDEGNIAVVTLLADDMKELGASGADCENIVDFAREIEETKIAVFLREVNNGVKISLRSKGDLDVGAVAAALGGGGHKNASGCCVTGKLDEVKSRVLGLVSGLF